jgi:hypothetical protein
MLQIRDDGIGMETGSNSIKGAGDQYEKSWK